MATISWSACWTTAPQQLQTAAPAPAVAEALTRHQHQPSIEAAVVVAPTAAAVGVATQATAAGTWATSCGTMVQSPGSTLSWVSCMMGTSWWGTALARPATMSWRAGGRGRSCTSGIESKLNVVSRYVFLLQFRCQWKWINVCVGRTNLRYQKESGNPWNPYENIECIRLRNRNCYLSSPCLNFVAWFISEL